MSYFIFLPLHSLFHHSVPSYVSSMSWPVQLSVQNQNGVTRRDLPMVFEYSVQKIAQNRDTQRKFKMCITAQNWTPGNERLQLTYTSTWLLYDHSNTIRRNCPRTDSNTRQIADRKTVTDPGDFWLAGMASTWCSSCQLAGPNVATFRVLFLCREKVSNLSDILTPKLLPVGKSGTCHFTSTPVRRWSRERTRIGVRQLNSMYSKTGQPDTPASLTPRNDQLVTTGRMTG
jgi:hypothetical protein